MRSRPIQRKGQEKISFDRHVGSCVSSLLLTMDRYACRNDLATIPSYTSRRGVSVRGCLGEEKKARALIVKIQKGRAWMNSQQMSPTRSASQEQLSSTRLHGRWIMLGRGAWMVLVVL